MQWNQDLATYLSLIVPDPENKIHQDGMRLLSYHIADDC
jgi:hypothetical protein